MSAEKVCSGPFFFAVVAWLCVLVWECAGCLQKEDCTGLSET